MRWVILWLLITAAVLGGMHTQGEIPAEQLPGIAGASALVGAVVTGMIAAGLRKKA